MVSERSNNTRGGAWRPGRGFVSAAALFLLLSLAPAVYSQRGQTVHPAPAPAPARPASPPPVNDSVRPIPNSYGQRAPARSPAMEVRPGVGSSARPGQEHLPQWLAQHQNMTPAEQENLLRREPGFNRLAPDQQQRVLNRLRTLDARPPAERQRMLARNELFERLSPEGKQQVRAAAQAMKDMPPGRKLLVGRAFNDLRRIPPAQRQAILNSARFSHDFSPQERHVLSSMLSVEPYNPGLY